MNASTIPDVFQHNVFAIGYLCVAGNIVSTLRTIAEPLYKMFAALGEHTWFFLTEDFLYVIVGSIIFAAGIITGLHRALRIRYGEYDPFPSDKVKNALKFGISFFLRAGIFSSIFLWIFALDTSDEIGDGAAIGYGIGIGIGLGLVYITIPGVLPLGGKADNAKIPVNEILVGILVGGSFGFVLCLFGIGFILSGLATKDATIIGAFLFIPFFAIIGGIIGGMIHGLVVISRFVTLMLHRAVFLAGSRLMFPLLGFKTIVCQHCLRYTVPSRSHYKRGLRSHLFRFCEHCQNDVERTNISGKVLFTFGTFTLRLGDQEVYLTNPGFEVLKQPGRVFICSNPGFKSVEKIVDISEVYIATKTCDPRKLERFITYMVHYGLQSVKVFYKGALDDFDEHLRNALRNTFECIELEGNV